MLRIPGFHSLKKILWKDISQGMILIGGIKINNGLPLEVARYPVLTMSLVNDLSQKYHFKPNKEVIVAVPKKGESATKMSNGFATIEKRISAFNNIQRYYRENRVSSNNTVQYIFDFNIVEPEYLLLGNYNSSLVRVKGAKIPSVLKSHESVTLGDIMTGRINNWNLPNEKEIQLHIGIGFSNQSDNKLYNEKINSTLLTFTDLWKNLFIDLRIMIHGFSTQCEEVHYPLTGREVPRDELIFTNFINKVLRNRNKDVINKVVLIVSNSPKDYDESILSAYKLKKLGIDLSIIFVLEENSKINKDQMKQLKDISLAGGGNLFIVKKIGSVEVVALEAFDNYLGNISLSNSILKEADFSELKPIVKIANGANNSVQKKIIKPFEFKKITK